MLGALQIDFGLSFHFPCCQWATASEVLSCWQSLNCLFPFEECWTNTLVDSTPVTSRWLPLARLFFAFFFPCFCCFDLLFFFLNGVFPELWHQLIFSRHFNDLKRSRFLVCLFDWLHLTGNWSELWNSKSVSQQINSLFPLFYHQNSLFDGKFTLPFDWFFLSVQAVGNSLERVKIFF